VTENGDVVQMTMDRTKFTAKWIKQDVEQQLSGSLCNRGTIITFARKSTNGSFLSNALLSGSYHGLAYVSSDARELQVMFSEDKSARYFGLKRATDQCE